MRTTGRHGWLATGSDIVDVARRIGALVSLSILFQVVTGMKRRGTRVRSAYVRRYEKRRIRSSSAIHPAALVCARRSQQGITSFVEFAAGYLELLYEATKKERPCGHQDRVGRLDAIQTG